VGSVPGAHILSQTLTASICQDPTPFPPGLKQGFVADSRGILTFHLKMRIQEPRKPRKTVRTRYRDCSKIVV
jgi:hypothetical protein